MKINSIKTYSVSIPLNTDFNISGGENTSADHVIVEIETDEGIIGWGEAAPLISYSGETMESIKFAIDNYLSKALIGEDPTNIVKIHEKMDFLKENYFAKAAIDFACYDITGKKLQVPVYKLLGGKYRDKISVGQSVGIKSVEETVKEAIQYEKAGFKSIKLKIGNDAEYDFKRIKEVGEAIDVPIRVDANQGYRFDEAVDILTKLDDFGLLLIEQPLPKWNLEGMAKLCDMLNTPILADESCYTIHDAINLIKYNAADIFNIKILKPGGLYNSSQIASIATSAMIPLSIGSMVEMGIGTAAGAHFAASVKYLDYPSDVKGPSLMADSILKKPIKIEDGYTHVPEGPGLGIEVDYDKLDKYKVD